MRRPRAGDAVGATGSHPASLKREVPDKRYRDEPCALPRRAESSATQPRLGAHPAVQRRSWRAQFPFSVKHFHASRSNTSLQSLQAENRKLPRSWHSQRLFRTDTRWQVILCARSARTMEPTAGEYVVNENDKDNETSGLVEAPQSFFRRYRVVLIVVVVFAAVVVFILRHHQRQQELAQMEAGAGAPGAHGGGGHGGGAGGFGGRGGGGGGRGGFGAPVAVAVASVAAGDIEVRIPALGTITPLATVTVRPQISGILTKIRFQEGQLVKAGDPLAEIDPRPFRAALDQAVGNLRRDQAQLVDAKLDLKRFEELIKEDSVAQQQLDTQRALVNQLGGTIESDQAQVETARINLQYTNIVSPVTGRVGLRQVDQGNYVTPGDTNGLVVVTELQPISAIFAIPEDNVTTLMQRLQQGATLSAEAYDRANSNKLAVGQVKTVDNQIDTTTGTIKLRALFDNKDGLLFPNQFVNIQLVVNVLHDQTVMPGSAVRRGAPNGVVSTFVYVVNTGNNTVSVRPIALGVIDGERVSVAKGLEPGDLVVTEGADRLRDGATVLLPANTPQHALTATPGRSHGGKGRRNRASQSQDQPSQRQAPSQGQPSSQGQAPSQGQPSSQGQAPSQGQPPRDRQSHGQPAQGK